MLRRRVTALDVPILLDPAAVMPLHRQLYQELRGAILAGRLPPGARLPATRTLARDLSVSRNTVVSAFEQLLAEGYVEGRIGSGTYVSSALPDDLLLLAPALPGVSASGQERQPSQRGTRLAATPVSLARDQGRPRPFRPGLPALDLLPVETLARLAIRHWRQPSPELFSYGDPAGYAPLRAALAEYLVTSRGIQCSADQVIIVAGSQQGLTLAAQVLLDPHDSVWVEDPGYIGARGAFISAGARLVAVPVDREGLDVTAGAARCPTARMAYITPSHQYPLGVTMSLARRLALLEWARRAGAWVLEDDYGSGYRYAGRPLPAVQGLDRTGCTIYLGTLSKVLFPGLRLGYLVVPAHLVATFVAARALIDRHGPQIEQAILADFINEGHFVRHIRRTRKLYAGRQAALRAALERELGGVIELAAADAGMHLVGWLPAGVDDRAASQAAAAHGIDAPALSAYAIEPQPRGGLLLGYAAFRPDELQSSARRLAAALRSIGVG